MDHRAVATAQMGNVKVLNELVSEKSAGMKLVKVVKPNADIINNKDELELVEIMSAD